MSKLFLTLFRILSKAQWFLLLFAITLCIFNIVLWSEPYIADYQRQQKIESIFSKYWQKEGAEKFRSVGLEPTEQLYQEELENYRTSFLEKNPPLIPEERISKMKDDFRKWWETGGNLTYVNQGIVPDSKLYNRELKKWVEAYTQQLWTYTIPFIPAEGNFVNLLIYWILMPSIFSLLSFFVLFCFTGYHLEKRWGVLKTLGVFISANIIGGFFVNLLSTTTFFHSYENDLLKGMSLGLATLLGATSMGKTKNEISKIVVVVSGLLLMVDIAINWFLNPGIYAAVVILSLFFYGIGLLLGLKMPYRKQTLDELRKDLLEEKRRNRVDPYVLKKNKTRENLMNGLSAARRGENTAGGQLLTDGMQALLQEYPIDTELLNSTAKEMVSPSLFIEIISTQWLEWGVAANNKNIPEVALLFLEKSLATEKSESMARKALFQIGEIRIRCDINAEEGALRLQKVLELNDKDIIAAQARKILEKRKSF
ncbi:MAG TPA: hypothetical protein PLT31_06720 [Fibrobacteraceae bacterium]|jgi:hypothetical protein|nr:hypothetical protein [Fibrobacteraceae bacterium]